MALINQTKILYTSILGNMPTSLICGKGILFRINMTWAASGSEIVKIGNKITKLIPPYTISKSPGQLA